MRRLLVFALAGLFGQVVDGALGMAFGVTSSTVLLSSGINPAASNFRLSSFASIKLHFSPSARLCQCGGNGRSSRSYSGAMRR